MIHRFSKLYIIMGVRHLESWSRKINMTEISCSVNIVLLLINLLCCLVFSYLMNIFTLLLYVVLLLLWTMIIVLF